MLGSNVVTMLLDTEEMRRGQLGQTSLEDLKILGSIFINPAFLTFSCTSYSD